MKNNSYFNRKFSIPGKIIRLLRRMSEIDEIRIVYSVLKKFDGHKTMIDVGAHYGGSIRRFASRGWRIYAFEPDSENREILQNNYGVQKNVTIEDRAVSNVEKSNVPFFNSDISTGISGLSEFHDSHTQHGVVEVTTLEKYIREKRIGHVSFLKIDAEGYDLFVLKGINWAETQPDVIVCEFENNKTEPLGYRFDDLAQYLEQKGYLVLVSEWFPIVRYGGLHRWKRFIVYPCGLDDEHGWGNLIACREKEIFNRLRKAAGRASFLFRTRRLFAGAGG